MAVYFSHLFLNFCSLEALTHSHWCAGGELSWRDTGGASGAGEVPVEGRHCPRPRDEERVI